MATKLNTARYFEGKYQKIYGTPRNICFAVYDRKIWAQCIKLLKHCNVVADFGAGVGTLLYNVSKVTSAKLISIDQAKSALQESKTLIPRLETLNEDILNTSLANNSLDFCLSTMTIEHVDDKKFASEVFRVLKPGGYFFVTSVIKSKNAWYFHKNANGEIVLEPTHLREYKSADEFERLLKSCEFNIIQTKTPRIRFPLLDPLFKAIIHLTHLKNFLEIKPIEFLRLNSRIPIPGYFAVETLAQKRSLNQTKTY